MAARTVIPLLTCHSRFRYLILAVATVASSTHHEVEEILYQNDKQSKASGGRRIPPDRGLLRLASCPPFGKLRTSTLDHQTWQRKLIMKTELFSRPSPAIDTRCIHLDLKGMPPTDQRLLELPDILAALRINCVLIEWEDTYPWTVHQGLCCETAYSPRTVRAFLEELSDRGIEAIPLVQCLGHCENVLLQEEFAHLRELPESSGELCPMRPESAELYMGTRGLHALIWDDEIRDWPMELLESLKGRVDLVVWKYAPDIFDGIAQPLRPYHLERYSHARVGWWGAPAFKKTADGDLPSIPERLANIEAWLRVLEKQPKKAMIVTGWSRGSFGTTARCGLEPAWDAIVLSAALMWDGRTPDDPIDVARDYLHRGPLERLVGQRFEACYQAALQLSKWHQQMATSPLWALLEHAAAISFEPKRVNAYLLERFHKLGDQRRELQRGISLGKEFVSAHQGLVPDHWLRLYVKARVGHSVRRFNQMTGALALEAPLPESP